ncbi:MAG: HlyD protein [Candidatus Levybacteria bacterium]|nr:HlyD protein [Candidatus Levybacteria bacterium]
MKALGAISNKIKKLPGKYKIIGLIIIAVLGLFIFFGNKKTVPLQFITVKKQNIRQEISGSGTLSGTNSASLHFKISGKLTYLKVSAGDKVAKGQVIGGLDTQDLEIALRQAQNTLRDKRAIVDRIRDDTKDNTSETYTQRQTRTTAEVAQDNAYDSVLAAQRAFQDSVIISPIAGVVTKVDFLPGQNVSPADIIAQVVDFSAIVFSGEVDEADIAKVSVGQSAEITLNAYGNRVFQGKVSEIFQETEITSNGATVVIVKILLDDQTVKNIAGLNGQVNIITSEKNNVLTVPLDTLQNGNTVFVKTVLGLKKQKIEVGLESDTEAEITDGLKEGDQIVTNPADVPNNLK